MPIVRAIEPFAYTDTGGVPRVVAPGQLFESTDPCVVKRPHLFERVEVAAARATETASAAPGEVRSRPRMRKSTAAPAADPAE